MSAPRRTATAPRTGPDAFEEFLAWFDELVNEHGLTRSAVTRQMRSDAEKKIADASKVLQVLRTIEEYDRDHRRPF